MGWPCTIVSMRMTSSRIHIGRFGCSRFAGCVGVTVGVTAAAPGNTASACGGFAGDGDAGCSRSGYSCIFAFRSGRRGGGYGSRTRSGRLLRSRVRTTVLGKTRGSSRLRDGTIGSEVGVARTCVTIADRARA